MIDYKREILSMTHLRAYVCVCVFGCVRVMMVSDELNEMCGCKWVGVGAHDMKKINLFALLYMPVWENFIWVNSIFDSIIDPKEDSFCSSLKI